MSEEDTLRRDIDRTLIGGYETRITRIEVQFDHISRDIGRLEHSQVKMLEHSEQTATAMAQIAAKLAADKIGLAGKKLPLSV